MDEVIRSVSQWESDEPEFQLSQFNIKLPYWMKITTDEVADKLFLSASEFIRRSVVYQLYYELHIRQLITKNDGESVEQAVYRFYHNSLKGGSLIESTTDTTSGE